MNPTKLTLALLLALVAGPMTSVFSTAAQAQTYNEGDAIFQWCNDTLAALTDARNDAQAFRTSNPAQAKAILIQGLRRARENGHRGIRLNGALTYKALSRGITLAESIDYSVRGARNGDRTTLHFLNNYYDFVIYTVQSLDIPYTARYRGCRCSPRDDGAYEANFIEYTRRQVEMVLTTLATSDRRFVTPIGAPQALLSALELTSGYAADDLRETLWSNHYSCQIEGLEWLSARLSRFNAGQRVEYVTEVDAVNRAYRQAKDLIRDITPRGGCGAGYGSRYDRDYNRDYDRNYDRNY